MAEENLFDEQIRRELEMMGIFLSTKAVRTALTIDEFVQSRLAAGATREEILRQLIDDLQNNGRMFSEFRRAIKSTARGSINRVRDVGYFSEEGIQTKYRWSAILVKTCPDCLDRHGQVKTWDEWEAEGMPRAGATVCRENCHCVLVAERYSALEPIKRN